MLGKIERMKFGVVLAVLIGACLAGCKEKADPPGITLSSPKLSDGILEAAENETVPINVKIEAPGGVQLLRVTFEGINKPP